MNFIYTVDPSAEEPIMLVNKHIGMDDELGQGISGDQFQSELMTLDSMGKRRVEVWINSPGGDVMEGYNMYAAIKKTNCKVDTYCVGLAASIAGVIFQGGRKRVMMSHSRLMYHPAFNNASGKNSDVIKNFNSSIAQIISDNTGTPHEEVTNMMVKNTWMSAQEAMASGFCDAIDDMGMYNKGRLAKVGNSLKEVTEPLTMWKEAATVMNSILPQKQLQLFDVNNSMKEVAKSLGLSETASEKEIVAAISEMKNKTELLEESQKTTASQISELTSVVNKLSDESKERKDADEKAATESLEREADLFVAEQVRIGKVSNKEEDIKAIKASFMKDPVGIKSALGAMVVNKQSVTIPGTGADKGNDSQPSVANMTMAAKMAQVRNKLNI